MLRRILPALVGLLVVLPAAAQTPAGWRMRVDASTDVNDPDDVPEVRVTTVANGFEVHTGPAVTLWNPANNATGNYTLEGNFTLLAPSLSKSKGNVRQFHPCESYSKSPDRRSPARDPMDLASRGRRARRKSPAASTPAPA